MGSVKSAVLSRVKLSSVCLYTFLEPREMMIVNHDDTANPVAILTGV